MKVDWEMLARELNTITEFGGELEGVIATAEAAEISRKGVQKVLSEEGNPLFENVNAILHAMGYQLLPQALAIGESQPH